MESGPCRRRRRCRRRGGSAAADAAAAETAASVAAVASAAAFGPGHGFTFYDAPERGLRPSSSAGRRSFSSLTPIQQQRTSPSADITDPYGRSLMHQQGQRSAGPYVASPSSTTHHKAVLAAAAAAQRSRQRQSAGGASGNAMERLDALAARARSFRIAAQQLSGEQARELIAPRSAQGSLSRSGSSTAPAGIGGSASPLRVPGRIPHGYGAALGGRA